MTDEAWTAEAALGQLKDAMDNKGMTVDEMFAALDGDSDGKINGPELHRGILEHLGDLLSPGQISDIIVALDANKDNRIDLSELRSALSDVE